jgi:hypothetical protein
MPNMFDEGFKIGSSERYISASSPSFGCIDRPSQGVIGPSDFLPNLLPIWCLEPSALLVMLGWIVETQKW